MIFKKKSYHTCDTQLHLTGLNRTKHFNDIPLFKFNLSPSPYSLSKVRPHGTSPYCLDLLSDGGCVALLIIGFLLVTPLLVLALAAYCRLARHLQLSLCFIPYSRAVYKNLPVTYHYGLGGGCCIQDAGQDRKKGKVWV